MTKTKSRPKRWAEAIEKGQKALSDLETALMALEEAGSDLNDVRQEYEDWKDNLPDNLQSSPLADKLNEVSDLDITSEIDSLRSAFDTANDLFSTAEGLDLPRGFGRD